MLISSRINFFPFILLTTILLFNAANQDLSEMIRNQKTYYYIQEKLSQHSLGQLRLYHPVELLSNNKAYRAESHYSLMSIIKSQEEIHQKLAEMQPLEQERKKTHECRELISCNFVYHQARKARSLPPWRAPHIEDLVSQVQPAVQSRDDDCWRFAECRAATRGRQGATHCGGNCLVGKQAAAQKGSRAALPGRQAARRQPAG